MTDPVNAVEVAGRAKLAAYAARIRATERACFDAGEMLREIVETSLYRYTHETFEAWCKDELGFTSRRAQQLISIAATQRSIASNWGKLAKHVSQTRPNLTCDPGILEEPPELATRHVVALSRVSVERRAEAMVLAVVSSGSRDPSIKAIREAALEVRQKYAPLKPLPAPSPAGAIRPEVAEALSGGVSRFAAVLEKLSGFARELKGLVESPFGIYLHPADVDGALNQLRGYLQMATPAAACPNCAQAGCQACRTAGWVCRATTT